VTVVDWDDRPGDDLAAAVGAEWACLRRLTLGPGEPLHLDAEDRETVVWALDRDAVMVRGPEDAERSVRAEGTMDVLVFAVDAPPAAPDATPRPGTMIEPSALEGERLIDGLTSITRRDVGGPVGAVGVAIELVEITPGRRSLPVSDLDEVSVVLRGAGQVVVDGQEPWVARGCVVGRGERYAAGPQGLRVLSFRERPRPA